MIMDQSEEIFTDDCNDFVKQIASANVEHVQLAVRELKAQLTASMITADQYVQIVQAVAQTFHEQVLNL